MASARQFLEVGPPVRGFPRDPWSWPVFGGPASPSLGQRAQSQQSQGARGRYRHLVRAPIEEPAEADEEVELKRALKEARGGERCRILRNYLEIEAARIANGDAVFRNASVNPVAGQRGASHEYGAERLAVLLWRIQERVSARL